MNTYEYETNSNDKPKIKIIARIQESNSERNDGGISQMHLKAQNQGNTKGNNQRNDLITIFTSQQVNNTKLVVSNNPLNNNIIKQRFKTEKDLYGFSQSLSNDALLYSYDKVISGQQDNKQLYQQEIREFVLGMLNGINSSVFFFGPINSGKTSSLLEEENERSGSSTILNLALYDLTNMINQGNCSYIIRLSIYQVYMDCVHDLLCEDIKQINIENLKECLIQQEIGSQNDYDCCVKNAINHQKYLSQLLKVNDLRNKSHLIISLILEKVDDILKNEHSIDNNTQIDFVVLSSSNYGLSFNENKQLCKEEYLCKGINRDFEGIMNHIVALSKNNKPTIDTILTILLRKALRSSTNILFINNVIPWENPIDESLKSIRFTTWIKEQIGSASYQSLNQNKNISNINSSDNDNSAFPSKDNNPSLESSNKNYKEDIFKKHHHSTLGSNKYSPIRPDDNNYNIDSPSSNDEKELKIREKIKKKFQQEKINDISSPLFTNTSKNTNQKKNVNHSYINNPQITNPLPYPEDIEKQRVNNTFTYDPQRNKDKQIEILNQSLIQLRQQNNDMNKRLDFIQNQTKTEKKQKDDSQYLNTNITPQLMNQNHPNNVSNSQYIEYSSPLQDFEKIKQENTTLKSDNIILREDINHLTNLNRHLEDELSNQRSRNLDLAAENERILQERIAMSNEVQKVNESISKVKFQEHNLMESFNQRMMIENKMRDNENELMRLREDKQRFEIDFRVIKDRYDDIIIKYERVNNELMFTKEKYESEIDKIEDKVNIMTREMDKVQRENITFRASDERQRNDIVNLEKQRDNFRDKYQEVKQKNSLLTVKIGDIENDFKQLINEKENEEMMKTKDEETKRYKIDSKQKIVNELQAKIANYRSERMKKGKNA